MTLRSRLPELDDATMSAEQRRVLDDILSGPRGNLDGPFLAWVHSPQLADHAQRLGAFCRYHTSLPLRLTELAILTTAAWWKSQAEWQIHAPIALKAGLSESVVEALREGRQPTFERSDEVIVHRLASVLYQHRRVDQATYDRAVEAFGEEAVVELVGVLGYYALVAMTLNVFEVRRGDEPLPFDEP
ncbi:MULTISPECIES: carboxymuconolactone decarboxylase family protein [Halomonas]|jgi:4-carboxymuconolactone decarboxylase|uniref:Carboxymuconolactone decarboxylase family protein n=3 Tax=Halomonas TaxID=2745 RepID=A0AAU7KD94_9GAMM|nr:MULTISPECIES: carboxymuconolactone decarboxylase family protein [Halomonas]MBR9880980.1 carboxymuconolactone decarboxylase family protein [Gammaproteobacteria bacterium]HAR08092.1 carboxymuconolactone decarboxylase family protein [Cobetia sp.]KJZ06387.1 4-carboxymuconolactone decarboxylase [Halomonas sp. S2151]MBY5941232.1 carboxymuconolactone decarboxylase family protein [Halomonas sp. DP5N14-9]MBY6111588.1 carboxymuconolactone decarboxylase family protein [Halomonas sp. DP1Y21-3]|tara:strand:+ start:1034 stop:1594 length:561 start_codon:yes stop_codon:yes gene_type:complete